MHPFWMARNIRENRYECQPLLEDRTTHPGKFKNFFLGEKHPGAGAAANGAFYAQLATQKMGQTGCQWQAKTGAKRVVAAGTVIANLAKGGHGNGNLVVGDALTVIVYLEPQIAFFIHSGTNADPAAGRGK